MATPTAPAIPATLSMVPLIRQSGFRSEVDPRVVCPTYQVSAARAERQRGSRLLQTGVGPPRATITNGRLRGPTQILAKNPGVAGGDSQQGDRWALRKTASLLPVT
jgi:hypothetical protein